MVFSSQNGYNPNQKIFDPEGGHRATFISDYLIFYIATLHQVIALFLTLVFSVFNVPFSCTDFPKFVVADEKLEKMALI